MSEMHEGELIAVTFGARLAVESEGEVRNVADWLLPLLGRRVRVSVVREAIGGGAMGVIIATVDGKE